MATRVGIRELRAQLASHLESVTPIEVTRQGHTIVLYVPLPQQGDLDDRERLLEAGRLIQAELERLGLTEEDLSPDGGAQATGHRREHPDSWLPWLRVRTLIAKYADREDFFVAEANVAEAADYIADLAREKNLDEEVCTNALLSLMRVVQMVEDTVLESARDKALARIRDADDWPALALGLQLECAIWTEDKDFFGTGIATWTSRTVVRYMNS
ncbi:MULTISPECIES: PIN domain-containing protein [unclassified Synechococcus]|uniref:PIN domain-containing protein n=1 Tax=unclassified Synechococcus TaxID=2626047 RepID=UPI0000699045|nr:MULTISPECIES: PIN domain-containing protein [unclassified Synechococcus]EAQ74234.1 hypothetical protein WH5701_06371 [Synechococcus sp. WH 5701]WFN60027.1 PIN domain-containing protein [Synechococcus sp. CCFWC 502]